MSKSRSPSTCGSPPGSIFSAEVVDRRPGIAILAVSGERATEVFANESGGHRWQRVPATERAGRVQTSTVTVAVLPEPTEAEYVLDPREVEWTACRGSGAGGQHRNVTASAVQVKHLPSGLLVRCESERSQHQNRRSALALLRARLWAAEKARVDGARSADRRAQVGSGMRGDKRRTIRVRDGVVKDHVTGKTWRLREYLRGEW